MVLRYLASKDVKDLVSVREICQELAIPFDTTSKVMQSFNHHGILHSCKGIKGGYSLKKNLKELNYLEIVEIIEGEIPKSFCVGHKGLCDLHKTCNIIGPVERLNMRLTDYLSNLSVEDILFGE